jgi:putative phosphoribosyl transferase
MGRLDYPVIRMNKYAYRQLNCKKEFRIIAGATHLFEEPGTLEEVARLAAEWFERHLVLSKAA